MLFCAMGSALVPACLHSGPLAILLVNITIGLMGCLAGAITAGIVLPRYGGFFWPLACLAP